MCDSIVIGADGFGSPRQKAGRSGTGGGDLKDPGKDIRKGGGAKMALGSHSRTREDAWMMVADEKITRFNLRPDSDGGGIAAALPSPDRDGMPKEHDARSLVIAVAMCLGCWLVLGYFLLS